MNNPMTKHTMQESMEVAEAARETEWKHPSFAAGIFSARDAASSLSSTSVATAATSAAEAETERVRQAARLLHQGDLDAAVRQYEALSSRADATAAVLNNLAWLYCTRSRDPEHGRRARELAERARALEPWSDEVLGTLGAACLRSGDPAAAVRLLEPLVARRHEWAQSSGFLVEARAQLLQRAEVPG